MKAMLRISSIFLLINLFSNIVLSAQTIISGNVSDKKGELLTGANIYLLGTYDGISSDVDGNFLFKTDETGEQILKVDFIGYEGFEEKVILDGNALRFTVVLKEKFNQMKAVTITAGTFEAGDEKRSATLSSLDMVMRRLV